MTKQERILKQQVKELENLIEVKDAVIAESEGILSDTQPQTNEGE